MRIDAHQHFWRLERGDLAWPTPDLAPLRRDFGPQDLKPHIDRHHVARTILVQASLALADTGFMLELAKDTPFVAGVVGCADLKAADAPQTIETLAADPRLVGLRPMIGDTADADWAAKPELTAALQALAAHKLVCEVPNPPGQPTGLHDLFDRHPDVAFVVGHGAKSFIREGSMNPWRDDIAAIAKHPNTVCKLSGLVAEAGQDWRVSHLRPHMDHLLAVFGPPRLLWGSDWPIVNLAGGYDRWMEASEALLGGLDEAEWDAIFGGNAARVYLSRSQA